MSITWLSARGIPHPLQHVLSLSLIGATPRNDANHRRYANRLSCSASWELTVFSCLRSLPSVGYQPSLGRPSVILKQLTLPRQLENYLQRYMTSSTDNGAVAPYSAALGAPC